MDVPCSILELVGRHPAVATIELVGSRSRADATALSDWDFRIEAADAEQLVRDLPAWMQAMQPLAGQWDRLSTRAVYMLILPGGVKVDLFPGDRPHEIEPRWRPGPDNLSDIDAHFWDWILWLGGKVLARRASLVHDELVKLHDHLLCALGAAAPPGSVHEAVQQYEGLRDAAERAHGAAVDRRLAHAVAARLRTERLLD